MTTILFDLENVLIHSVGRNIVHPDAFNILNQAKKDFGIVGLWTACDVEEVKISFDDILKSHDLWKYFDRIIMMDMTEDWQIYYTDNKIQNGKIVETKMLGQPSKEKSLLKDLNLLGNPEDYVLIDDGKSRGVGKPLNRIVGVKPYCGQKEHSLWPAYREALELSR